MDEEPNKEPVFISEQDRVAARRKAHRASRKRMKRAWQRNNPKKVLVGTSLDEFKPDAEGKQ